MKPLLLVKQSVWELYSSSPDEKTRAYAREYRDELENNFKRHQNTVNDLQNILWEKEIDYMMVYRGELKPKYLKDRDVIFSCGGNVFVFI